MDASSSSEVVSYGRLTVRTSLLFLEGFSLAHQHQCMCMATSAKANLKPYDVRLSPQHSIAHVCMLQRVACMLIVHVYLLTHWILKILKSASDIYSILHLVHIPYIVQASAGCCQISQQESLPTF